jgi:serine protease Do
MLKHHQQTPKSGPTSLSLIILALTLLALIGVSCTQEPSTAQTISAEQLATATPNTTELPPPQQSTSDSHEYHDTSGPTPVQSLPSVAEVVEKVKPSVVSIAVTVKVEQCDLFLRCRIVEQQGAGTGVIFDEQGLIVTNNHVIEAAVSIIVSLVDETTYNATLVGADPTSDLAVIRIPGENLPYTNFADYTNLKVGDWVIAIGNALSLVGGPTVTVGVVGALDRIIVTEGGILYDMIQTDAAINPGNSGGPLVNLNGEIVGINTARTPQGEGIGFAVGTFTVSPVVDSIVKHGNVVFPWLGVGVGDVTPVIAAQEGFSVGRGVILVSINPEGPSQKSGLRVGDIITAFNNTNVSNVKQLQKEVRQEEVGETSSLTVVRGDKTLHIDVVLEEMPRG